MLVNQTSAILEGARDLQQEMKYSGSSPHQACDVSAGDRYIRSSVSATDERFTTVRCNTAS